MAKEASKSCREDAGLPRVALVNTGDPELEYAFYQAERRGPGDPGQAAPLGR